MDEVHQPKNSHGRVGFDPDPETRRQDLMPDTIARINPEAFFISASVVIV